MRLHLRCPTPLNRFRGYKTFLMLNSAEHAIYPAHKCQNANNCWHFTVGIFTFISMINTTSKRLKLKHETFSVFGILVFMSSWNFVLSWVEHENSFINSGPVLIECASQVYTMCTEGVNFSSDSTVSETTKRLTKRTYQPSHHRMIFLVTESAYESYVTLTS